MAPTGSHRCGIALFLLCVPSAFTSAFSTERPPATNVDRNSPLRASSAGHRNDQGGRGTIPRRPHNADGGDADGARTATRRHALHSIVARAAVVGGAVLSPGAARASTRDPRTGTLLPSVGEIAASLPETWDDDDDPRGRSFARLDPAPDAAFYADPRFVEHVDAEAVEAMTAYISERVLRDGDAVLDLCSSWTSHIRPPAAGWKLARVAGLGMNAKELEANAALTERTVLDLNAAGDVRLPYADASFDAILLQLSIDYLIHPLEVLREAARVLRPGGRIAVLFSNRLFLSKAVGLWTGADDVDHAYTVGSYLHFAGGGFEDVRAEDLSTRRRGREQAIVGDPLYVVTATKGGRADSTR